MLSTHYHQSVPVLLSYQELQERVRALTIHNQGLQATVEGLQARVDLLNTSNKDLQNRVNYLTLNNTEIRNQLDAELVKLHKATEEAKHLKAQLLNLSLNFEDKQDTINQSIQSELARLKDQAQQSLERISSQIPDDPLASLETRVALLEQSLISQADTQPSQSSLKRLLEEIKIAQKQCQSLLDQAQSLEPQPIKRR